MGAAGAGALCGRAWRGLEAAPGRCGRQRGRWPFRRLGFGARRPCRGRSPACLVFSSRWIGEGGAVARGRGPGARGGGGRWPARGAVSPAAARRRPAAVFVRGATARAEPVRRGESRPSRWLWRGTLHWARAAAPGSLAAGHFQRTSILRAEATARPTARRNQRIPLTRMRWSVTPTQHAACSCDV